jgi:phospholipid/cholesterol/gamma-HCH transport system ATP-binding protein
MEPEANPLPSTGARPLLRKGPGEVLIRVSGLRKSFDDREVLSGIDLEVRRGEVVVIMGGSGCGKSTLLRHLIGAVTPDHGTVELFGKDLATLDEDGLNAIRKRFGILFQSGALFNSLTVGENVALPLREHTDLDDEVIRIILKMKLELVGLRDFEALMPSQISGGMKKRVGLARAMALDPEIIFYDEPGAGLDPVMAGVIDKLILDFSRKLAVTSVVVTHEMGSAFRIADRMVMLYEGRVVASGTPEEIRTSTDPVVKQFIHGEPDGPIPLRRSRIDYETDILA